MLPYVINGLVCCALTYIGTHCKPRSAGKIFFILTVFCTCFMAGVRDSTVGTDMLVYGDRLFAGCQGQSLNAVFSRYSYEPLYLLITWFLANFSNRYVYYFLLQFLVFVPIYSTVLKQEQNDRAWIGVFIYHIWMYSYTFNLLRQSIAVAILVYATNFIFEKKYNKYIILTVIAIGFHSTAVIGFIPLLIYLILVYQPANTINETGRIRFNIGSAIGNSLNNFKTRYHVLLNIILILVEVYLVYNAASLITLVNTATGEYNYQVSHINDSFTVSTALVMTLIAILATLYLTIKSEGLNSEPINQFYLIMLITGFILFLLYGVSSQMYRVSLYFTCHFPVFISRTFENKKKDIKYYFFLGLIICLFAFFYSRTVLRTWNGVIPYTSEFLGIF